MEAKGLLLSNISLYVNVNRVFSLLLRQHGEICNVVGYRPDEKGETYGSLYLVSYKALPESYRMARCINTGILCGLVADSPYRRA